MINRQKLIEAAEKEYYKFIDDDTEVAHNRAIYDVIKIIESQPPADQWIPCSSGKMPKDGQTVPITILLSEGKRLLVHATYHAEKPSYWHPYDWNGKGFYIHDSEFGECKYETVIAWLDVEPYKGVE